MWNILSFENLQQIKCIFLVWPLGGFFLDFQLGLICFEFYLLVLHFCLKKSVVDIFRNLSFTVSILDNIYINKPPNIRMIAGSNKIIFKNPSGSLFTFCRINVYGLECFRCVCHDRLSGGF